MNPLEAITSNGKKKILPENEKNEKVNIDAIEILQLIETSVYNLEVQITTLKYQIFGLKAHLEDTL